MNGNWRAWIYYQESTREFVFQNYNAGSYGDLLLNPSGGNVGVRNSTPNYPLDVAGDLNFTGGLRYDGNLIIDTNGFILPKSSADAAAPNNSIYYSTDSSKLAYKDSGGTTHDLY